MMLFIALKAPEIMKYQIRNLVFRLIIQVLTKWFQIKYSREWQIQQFWSLVTLLSCIHLYKNHDYLGKQDRHHHHLPITCKLFLTKNFWVLYTYVAMVLSTITLEANLTDLGSSMILNITADYLKSFNSLRLLNRLIDLVNCLRYHTPCPCTVTTEGKKPQLKPKQSHKKIKT